MLIRVSSLWSGHSLWPGFTLLNHLITEQRDSKPETHTHLQNILSSLRLPLRLLRPSARRHRASPSQLGSTCRVCFIRSAKRLSQNDLKWKAWKVPTACNVGHLQPLSSIFSSTRNETPEVERLMTFRSYLNKLFIEKPGFSEFTLMGN